MLGKTPTKKEKIRRWRTPTGKAVGSLLGRKFPEGGKTYF